MKNALLITGKSIRTLLLGTALFQIASVASQAAPYTWNNAVVTGTWSSTPWLPPIAGGPSAGDTAIFNIGSTPSKTINYDASASGLLSLLSVSASGSSAVNITLNRQLTLGQIDFSGTTGALQWTLNNNLTLASGLSVMSNGSVGTPFFYGSGGSLTIGPSAGLQIGVNNSTDRKYSTTAGSTGINVITATGGYAGAGLTSNGGSLKFIYSDTGNPNNSDTKQDGFTVAGPVTLNGGSLYIQGLGVASTAAQNNGVGAGIVTLKGNVTTTGSTLIASVSTNFGHASQGNYFGNGNPLNNRLTLQGGNGSVYSFSSGTYFVGFNNSASGIGGFNQNSNTPGFQINPTGTGNVTVTLKFAGATNGYGGSVGMSAPDINFYNDTAGQNATINLSSTSYNHGIGGFFFLTKNSTSLLPSTTRVLMGSDLTWLGQGGAFGFLPNPSTNGVSNIVDLNGFRYSGGNTTIQNTYNGGAVIGTQKFVFQNTGGVNSINGQRGMVSVGAFNFAPGAGGVPAAATNGEDISIGANVILQASSANAMNELGGVTNGTGTIDASSTFYYTGVGTSTLSTFKNRAGGIGNLTVGAYNVTGSIMQLATNILAQGKVTINNGSTINLTSVAGSGLTVTGGSTNGVAGTYSLTATGLNGGGTLTNNAAGVAASTTVTLAGSGFNNFSGTLADADASHVVNLTLGSTNTATQILSGNNTYHGNTTINGGNVIAKSAAALGNSPAVSVASGAGLQYQAKADTAMAINGTLTLGTPSGAATTFGGSVGAGTASAAVNVTGAATLNANNLNVNVYGVNGTTPVAGTNNYTLLSAASGLGSANPTLGLVYNNTNFTVGGFTVSPTSIQVAITQQTALGANAYWTGGFTGHTDLFNGSNGSSLSNWSATSGGAVQALTPGAGTTINIDTVGATGTLGADMSVAGINVTAAGGINLGADGNAVTVGAGGVTVGNTVTTASTIGADVVQGSAFTWTNNSTSALTVSGAISGTNLTTGGTGKIILTGTNTYTGNTSVTGGTLAMGNGTASGTLGSTIGGNLAISSGATFDLAGTPVSVGQLTGAGTITNSVAGTEKIITIGTNVASGTYTFDGVFASGAGITDFNKVGAATLVLSGASGANSMTGYAQITAGTLTLGASNLFPSATIVVNNGTTLNFGTTSQSVAGLIVNNGTISGTGTITSASDFDLQRSGGAGIAAVLAGANSSVGVLKRNDGGTTILSGQNIYTGATHILSGTLQAGSTQAFGVNSAIVLENIQPINLGFGNNGGVATLALNTFSNTVGSLSGGGNMGGNVNLGTATLTVGTDNTSPVAFGGIMYGTGSLVKTGTGTQIFAGSNTYTGTTQVNNGVLALTGSSGAAILAGAGITGTTIGHSTPTPADYSGIVTVSSSSAFQVGQMINMAALGGNATITQILDSTHIYVNVVASSDASNQSITALAYSGVGSGAVTVANGASLTLASSALQFHTNTLTLNGTGFAGQSGAFVNVSGTNSVGSLVVLASDSIIASDAGTLTLTNAGTINGVGKNLTLAGAGNGAINSIIGTGTGNVVKNGTGTWTLNGVNTYTGTTTVTAGTLALGVSNALNSSSAVAVTGGTLNIGTFANSVASVLMTSGAITGTGAGTLTSASDFNLQAGSVSATLAGLVGLTKTTSGTVDLTGINTYTGTTTVSGGTLNVNTTNGIQSSTNFAIDGGTLNVNAANGLAAATTIAISGGTLAQSVNGAINSNANVTVSSGTYDLGATSQTVNSLHVTGGNVTGAPTGALSSNTDFDLQAGTVSAVLSGGSGLVKSGTGTATLSSTVGNNYAGDTTITGGTLNVANTDNTTSATGAGTVNLGTVSEAAGTLGGTGYISGNIVVNNLGGAITPGTTSSIGSLHVGAVFNQFQSLTLNFAIDGIAASNSELFTAGSFFNDGSSLTLNLYDLGTNTMVANHPYEIISVGDTWSDPDSITANLLNSAYTLNTAYGTNGILFDAGTNKLYFEVNAAVVPEPSTWAMMIGGFALLVVWQRRRNKA